MPDQATPKKEFKVSVPRLKALLALALIVEPKRATPEVLNHALVSGEGEGTLYVTDQAHSLEVRFPEAKGMAPFLLATRALSEMLATASPYAEVSLTPRKQGLSVSFGAGGLSLSLAAGGYDQAEKFPTGFIPAPGVKMPQGQGTVDGDLFTPALTELVPYVVQHEKFGGKAPVLEMLAAYLGPTLTLVAVDGFRMAWKTYGGLSLPVGEGGDKYLLIKQDTVGLLSRLWSKQPGEYGSASGAPPAVGLAAPSNAYNAFAKLVKRRLLKVAYYDDRLSFTFGDLTLGAVRGEGVFPDHQSHIPSEHKSQVSVAAQDLWRALRQLSVLGNAEGSNGALRLEWERPTEELGKALLTLSVKGKDAGSATLQLPCTLTGDPGKIAVNVNYLLHYTVGKSGVIVLACFDRRRALLVKHGQDPAVVIQPMQMQWADEPKSEKKKKKGKLKGGPATVAAAALAEEAAEEAEPVEPGDELPESPDAVGAPAQEEGDGAATEEEEATQPA